MMAIANAYKNRIFSLLATIMAVIVFIISLDDMLDWGDDNFQYLSQARAIVDSNIAETKARFTEVVARSDLMATGVYPWGYPILLSIIYKFFGENIYLYKIFNFLLFIGIFFMLWYFGNILKLDCKYFIFISIFVINPSLIFFNHYLMSDLSFAFFVFISFLFFYKTIFLNDFNKEIIGIFLCGLFVGYATITRQNGVFLLPAFIAGLYFPIFIKTKNGILKNLVRNIKKNSYLAFALIIGFYIIFSSKTLIFGLENTKTYFYNLDDYKLIFVNFINYLNFPSIFFGNSLIAKIFQYVLSIFFVYAIINRFVILLPFTIYIFLTFVLYSAWKAGVNYRFALSLIPVFILISGVGLDIFRKRYYNNKYLYNLAIIFTYIICSFFILRTTYSVYKIKTGKLVLPTKNGPDSIYAKEAFNFMLENTTKDDEVIFFKPRVILHKYNKLAYTLSESDKLTRKNKTVIIYKKENEGDFIIKEHEIKIHKDYKQVFENRDFSIFKRINQG